MNQEEKKQEELKIAKKQEFLKKAAANKANFDLHKQLIEESISPLISSLQKESVKYFYETGTVSGSFLLALMDYAEKYANAKGKAVENTSKGSQTMGVNLNNLRKKAAFKLDDVIGELNSATFKIDGVFQDPKDNWIHAEKVIVLDVEEIQSHIDELRELVWSLCCCYDEGNPKFMDVSGEVDASGGLREFNPEDDEG